MRGVAVGVTVDCLLALCAAVHRLGEAILTDERGAHTLLVSPFEHLVLLKVVFEGDILQLWDDRPRLVNVHRRVG